MRRLALAFAVLAALLSATPASAHLGREPLPPNVRMAAVGSPCPGAALRADRVIEGSFGTAEQGSYVMVPFEVPAGVTAVRVKYCFDQPETPLSAQFRHTLDLGLWQGDTFRGWGGSSHPDVTVSPEGFSSEEDYRRDPKGHVPGRTTRGFVPGPIRPGRWEVELGVAAVVPQAQGDLDGRVAYRVEIELSREPTFADDPYRAAPYDAGPARRAPGWYAGDTHVHADHSALGDATMREVFDYAFGEVAKLDFVTLTDYVTRSGWGELGRHQGRYPGKLITRSAEVVTYRGHAHNHATGQYMDHRFGPVLERRPDGSVAARRGAREPSRLFSDIHALGGMTQVTHPTIFPSALFAGFCRGCPWDYSDAETRWERVDAYEVHTGPPGSPETAGTDFGPNPFTLTAIEEYDRLRRAGHRLAAVASSDSHNAGRTNNAVTQAPIGVGTTVVHMRELSEQAFVEGVQAGRTYAKVYGPDSPDLRLEASNQHGSAMIGDGLPGDRATLTARVIGGAPSAQARTLQVRRDGRVIATVPVSGADFRHEMAVSGRGDYRLQVMRGSAVDALTTPIALGTERRASGGGSAPGAGGRPRTRRSLPRLRLRVTPAKVRAGRRTRFRVRVTAAGRPVARALVRIGARRVRTNRQGRASLRTRFRRPGRRLLVASRRGHLAATVNVRVLRRVRR